MRATGSAPSRSAVGCRDGVPLPVGAVHTRRVHRSRLREALPSVAEPVQWNLRNRRLLLARHATEACREGWDVVVYASYTTRVIDRGLLRALRERPRRSSLS